MYLDFLISPLTFIDTYRQFLNKRLYPLKNILIFIRHNRNDRIVDKIYGVFNDNRKIYSIFYYILYFSGGKNIFYGYIN